MIACKGDKLQLFLPYSQREKAKQIEGYAWNKDDKCWEYPLDWEIAKKLLTISPEVQSETKSILAHLERIEKAKTIVKEKPVKILYPLKTKPYHHQEISLAFILASFGIDEGWEVQA